jgi:hypothetical protein
VIDRRQEVEVTRRREEGGERRSSDENRRRDGLVCISCENKDETLDEAKTIEPSFSERPFRHLIPRVLYPLYCNVALSSTPDHTDSRLADHLPIWIIVFDGPIHESVSSSSLSDHPEPRTPSSNHKPQTTNHKPQTTNHKPQTTNHKPQTTKPRPKPKESKRTHQPHPVRNSLPSQPSPPVPVFPQPTAPPTLPPVDLLPCPSWIR